MSTGRRPPGDGDRHGGGTIGVNDAIRANKEANKK